MYLFRLDATEKAEQILANAISKAHILGLNRASTYNKMPVFEDEMFTRVWWCMYVLDRRLALETGRPFVIQDMNIKVRTPFDVGDEWLHLHKSTEQTAVELAQEIKVETSLGRHIAVSSWGAMISTSRIVGDLWRVIYGDNRVTRGSSSVICDYLDSLIENSKSSLPCYLQYRADIPFEQQFAGLEWWQIKQCLFIHMVRIHVNVTGFPLTVLSALFFDPATCWKGCRRF